MRTVVALAVVVALGACSGEPGGWRKDTLADGRLSFEMPSSRVQHEDSTAVEAATCSDDACEYSVSVHTSEAFAKRMGTTEKTKVRWAGFFIVGLIQEEEGRSVEDEGQWTQGKLVGKWMQIALPAKPPERPEPIYRWLYAAAWEGQAVIVRFDAPQTTYDDDVSGPYAEQARERFVGSVTVE
jgi:hypothetical protein